jgi:sigma-B regulation protein RsbU (phosphoserine phosphatase)
MIAKQERDILAGEIKRVAGVAEEAQASLGKEQVKRRALESEREEVESELKLAQAIQTTMFPAPIQRPEVEAVARIIPTRYLGGDYAHFNVIEDHWLYLVLIDVSGHGISAARVHAMIRRLTLTEATPTEMLELLNEASRGLLQHTYFFMTGVMARLDIRTGELEIATAGHPEQILLRADGSLETLQTENRLLGMHEEILDRDQPSLTVQMRPGDSLVLFTDGLFELLEDGKGEVLGESGLRERIEGLGSLSPQLLIGEVLQELAHFQGRSDFDDDVTMLVARYGGGWSEEPGSPPQS